MKDGLGGILLLLAVAGGGYLCYGREGAPLRAYLWGVLTPAAFVLWDALVRLCAAGLFLTDRHAVECAVALFGAFPFWLGWKRPAQAPIVCLGMIGGVACFLAIGGYPTWGGVARLGPLQALLFAGFVTAPGVAVLALGALLALAKSRVGRNSSA